MGNQLVRMHFKLLEFRYPSLSLVRAQDSSEVSPTDSQDEQIQIRNILIFIPFQM